jgi:hypothetical protein
MLNFVMAIMALITFSSSMMIGGVPTAILWSILLLVMNYYGYWFRQETSGPYTRGVVSVLCLFIFVVQAVSGSILAIVTWGLILMVWTHKSGGPFIKEDKS